jgi:hypothetical protein
MQKYQESQTTLLRKQQKSYILFSEKEVCLEDGYLPYNFHTEIKDYYTQEPHNDVGFFNYAYSLK